ncbi:glucose-induced degradation protein 8 [Nematocida minor]|uniref:glucose-induced degradation protein 8 n=1 Tax=Nematocida minor TaxID=1912983 RepID=UPI00221E7181|nr:glucose-induced degradation protein 8 [Nematocida minor]KAI5191529.1 glucose-induced degradation protein 8 [Nematocida minor]
MNKKISRELNAIVDYLIFECHTETLEALNHAKDDLLSTREEMKQLCLSGEIEKMYSLVNKNYPNLLKKHPHVTSFIFSQIFIEYVRNNQPEKALEFGRNSIQNGQDITSNHDLFLLLAYKNPETCEKLREFLALERRERVFAAIDGLIKEKRVGNKISMLEYACKMLKYSSCLKKEE